MKDPDLPCTRSQGDYSFVVSIAAKISTGGYLIKSVKAATPTMTLAIARSPRPSENPELMSGDLHDGASIVRRRMELTLALCHFFGVPEKL